MKVVIFLLALILANCEAAKILGIYQSSITSHQIFFRIITEELLKRDHEVVVITTDAAYPNGKTPPNLTEINLRDLSYSIWKKEFLEDTTGRKDDLYSQIETAVNSVTYIIRNQYKSEEIQQLIKDKDIKFDLLLADTCFQPSVAFTHIYNVPLIEISTTDTMSFFLDNLGVPRHVIYYPNLFQERNYKLTTWETYKQIYADIVINALFANAEKNYDKEIRKGLVSTAPPLSKLLNNVDMILTNMPSIWTGVRPRPMNYMNIDELQPKSKGVIPEKLQMYLNSSKHGVIYMSFGTNVLPSTLPPDRIKVFLDVFSQLPYDVLWKWDKDEMLNKPINVKLFKWLPQAEVLTHPKIKLFITQGGQHSTGEAIDAGVPLICIPLMFDQFAQAERYVLHGIGEKLDFKTVTPDELKDTIENVIGKNSYRQNIIKLRTLIHDKPMASMDRVMWAIEYVMRHGGAHHMRSPSANLSSAEYFEFELSMIFAALSMIILCMVFKFLVLLKRLIFRSTRNLLMRGANKGKV